MRAQGQELRGLRRCSFELVRAAIPPGVSGFRRAFVAEFGLTVPSSIVAAASFVP